MRKTLLTVQFIALIFFAATAQSTFQKLVKGNGRTDLNYVSKTSDGYIHIGRLAENNDIVVTKFDTGTNMEWMHSFRSSRPVDYGSCKILQGSDGDYIGLTYFAPFVVFKLSKTGNVIWSKQIDFDAGAGYNLYSSTDMLLSSDGAIVITGGGTFTGHGGTFILKMSYADGDVMWVKRPTLKYDGNSSTSMNSLQQAFDGNYLVTGYSSLPRVKNFLAEFDANGNLIWSNFYKSYSGTPGAVIKTFDSNYLSAGSNAAIKSDSAGNMIWARKIDLNLPHVYVLFLNSVIQNADSSYTLAGYYIYHLYHNDDIKSCTIQLDQTGNVVQARSIGEGEAGKPLKFSSIMNTSDGGFLAAGDDYTEAEKRYLILAKFNRSQNTCSQDVLSAYSINTAYVHETRSLVETDITSFLIIKDYKLRRDSSNKSEITICSDSSLQLASMSENKIQAATSSYLNIYPNPGNGIFTFTVPSTLSGNVSIRVISLTGRVVYSEEVNAINKYATHTISLQNVADGIYSLVISNSKQEIRKQLIIMH